jgi:hypothetical protein
LFQEKNMKNMKFSLAFRCVDLNPRNLNAMVAFDDMRDKMREITFETFARHVDWQPIAAEMGYGRETGLFLRNDWCVRFHKSTYKGSPVYVMIHSAIEYVFANPNGPLFRNAWA